MSTIVQSQTEVTLESLPASFVYPEQPTSSVEPKQDAIIKEVELSEIPSSSSSQSDEEASAYTFFESQYEPCAPPPRIQNALVVTEGRKYQLVSDLPVPHELGPEEVMIRNCATGLNHIDWKSVDYNFCLPELPWITGREMSGVVDQVGSDVTSLKAGDRVWTSTYYKDRRAGCFQDLVTVPQHTVFPIPSGLDYNSSACLGVAGLTAAMSLWRWLGVPMSPPSAAEPQNREMMLVWGGSTVTGQFAIQIAAQAGLDVIAVCSSSTAALVSSLGAKHVVTYTDKTDFHVIGEILCLAQGRLTKAVDLVGAKTAKLVLQVIAACGGDRHVDFAPLAFMSSKEVIPSNATVHNVEMKQFVLDSACCVYGSRLNELVGQGSLRLPTLRILPGGLGAVEEGLKFVKEGRLAGEKLVVSFP